MIGSAHQILRATEGWLELGCHRQADSELEQLPPALQSTREVLKLRCRIAAAAEQWNELVLLGASYAMQYPKEPAFAEFWAWGEYKMGKVANAYSILTMAAERFEKTWRTCYYLACFSYALKRTLEATQWLTRAVKAHPNPMDLHYEIRRQPELEPVWQLATDR